MMRVMTVGRSMLLIAERPAKAAMDRGGYQSGTSPYGRYRMSGMGSAWKSSMYCAMQMRYHTSPRNTGRWLSTSSLGPSRMKTPNP